VSTHTQAAATEVESIGAEEPPAADAETQEHESSALFEELQRITPTGSYAIVALDPEADAELLEVLHQSGADTALSVIRVPSLNLRRLVDKGRLSLLPAATIATSPAALAAVVGSNRATANKTQAAGAGSKEGCWEQGTGS
jgi:hypothetical protein